MLVVSVRLFGSLQVSSVQFTSARKRLDHSPAVTGCPLDQGYLGGLLQQQCQRPAFKTLLAGRDHWAGVTVDTIVFQLTTDHLL